MLFGILTFSFLTLLLLFIYSINQHKKDYVEVVKLLNHQTKLIDKYAWDVETKRFELMEALKEVQQGNETLISLNQNLQLEINKRILLVKNQNEKIVEYHFINSHNLRAPIARILGLVSLIDKKELGSNELEVLNRLDQSAKELDATVHSIQQTLYLAEIPENQIQ